jgi:hypothetical protein
MFFPKNKTIHGCTCYALLSPQHGPKLLCFKNTICQKSLFKALTHPEQDKFSMPSIATHHEQDKLSMHGCASHSISKLTEVLQNVTNKN